MALVLLAAFHLYIGARLLSPLAPGVAFAGAAGLLALFGLVLTGLPTGVHPSGWGRRRRSRF
jgi:hypothetical protein